MPVNLSIKNVPDDLATQLRKRAARSHRSLQGELMAIIEEAVASQRKLTPRELVETVRDLKLATRSEAAKILRADRDAH